MNKELKSLVRTIDILNNAIKSITEIYDEASRQGHDDIAEMVDSATSVMADKVLDFEFYIEEHERDEDDYREIETEILDA